MLSYIDQFCFIFILCNFNSKWHNKHFRKKNEIRPLETWVFMNLDNHTKINIKKKKKRSHGIEFDNKKLNKFAPVRLMSE